MAKFEMVPKGGFEPGLSRLQVRHSTGELPRSISRREYVDGRDTLHDSKTTL